MSNLREIYKWIDGFDGKSLTPPPATQRFIEIVNEPEKSDKTLQQHAQFRTTLPFANGECHAASIIDVKQLVNNDGDKEIKTVYELTLRIKNKNITYWPGDTIGILPQNPDDVVNEIINRNAELKSKCRNAISLKLLPPANATAQKKLPKMPTYLPTENTTLYKLFKECVDLHAFAKKSMLWALCTNDCLVDETERRFLEILASREGLSIYADEILQKQKTFYALLVELQSWHFTLNNVTVLFEHLPRLMPRPYSISTSLLATESMQDYNRHSTIMKIIFSLNEPPGITTRMLQNLIFKYQVESTLDLSTNEQLVNLYLRQSNRFQLNDNDVGRPLIMIAIGTGLAPFLGFLEHRRQQRRRSKDKGTTSDSYTWLIFGCRRKQKQLCANVLKGYLSDGTLSRLSECFSRDPNAEGKRYVQDLIRSEADSFVELMTMGENNQSKTFICGNRKMVQDVRSAIEENLCKFTECSEIDAKATIDELVKSGRYVEDIWT